MNCIDLFCGCGGLSKGFENAGFSVVAAFDNWNAAILCYKNNFTHPVHNVDLHDWEKVVDKIEPLECDIIMGGPPCQDFSHAGKRIEGKRASLTVSYANIISKVKPKYFIMENVDRASKSLAYKEARQILKNSGYGLTEKTLNACYCGVPQNRKRFFCIGALNKPDGFLDGVLSASMAEFPLSVREYMGDSIDVEYYYRHPRTYDRRGIFSIDEPAPTVRGSNRPMPPEYKKHKGDVVDPQNGVRALTFEERAKLQTFPENYKWDGTNATNSQLLGNAVPVKLAEYIAKCLDSYLSGNYNKRDVGFIDWLKNEKYYSARAASDVLSRLRRIKRLMGNQYCTDTTIILDSFLENVPTSVKSQLRRAYVLFNEYTAFIK